MITGAHAVLFTTDADADRGFFRDVLEFPSVDAGGGWLIFGLPPAELAAHPADENGRHELYLMCDDINATVAELSARGADIPGPVTDEGWSRDRDPAARRRRARAVPAPAPVTARLRSSSVPSSLGCSGGSPSEREASPEYRALRVPRFDSRTLGAPPR